MKAYTEFAVEESVKLLSIDSPTGYTEEAASFVKEEFQKLGFPAKRTGKGGVLVELPGEGEGVLLEAHLDTLGGIVSEIKGNGRLKLSPLGGLNANNVETETCRVVTKFDGVFEGTCQLVDPSIHVNLEYSATPRNFDTVEIVLDELVSSAEEVKKLGISVGDIVCFEPRTVVTKNGFIKSRFLDDKLSVGILLGFAFTFPDMPLYLFFIPVPIKAKYMVIGYGVIEFFLGVSGSVSSVAHFAHLGGMLFGIILLIYWKKKGTLHRYN